jgi:FkbM family methyltransferase
VSNVRTDDTVYDIGSNVGTYAIFADAHTDGPVFAFEPGVKPIQYLRANITGESSIRIQNYAVGEQDGTTMLAADDVDHKTAHLTDGEKRSDNKTNIKTLDTIVTELGAPNVMKIDIEGQELALFRGAENMLDETPPREIFCEVHTEAKLEWGLTEGEVQSLRSIIKAAGYSLSTIGDEEDPYHIHATLEKE